MRQVSELAEIKRDLFFRLLDDAGRVFIHVRPSMDLEIGRRGLVGEELKNGITLVFNSRMKFLWGDYGIEATLVFGTTPEKCFIPSEAIDSVYSPEMKVELSMELTDRPPGPDERGRQGDHAAGSSAVRKAEGNVIEVDFHKKKQDS